MLLLSFSVESYNHCRWQSAFNGSGDKFQFKDGEAFMWTWTINKMKSKIAPSKLISTPLCTVLLLYLFVDSYNHCEWQSAFNDGGYKFQSKEWESFHLGLKPDQTNRQGVKFLLLNLFQPHCALCSFYLSLWKVTITVDDNLLSMVVATNFNLKDWEAFMWSEPRPNKQANKQTNKG